MGVRLDLAERGGSHRGLPEMRPPSRSAWYSRERLTAICTSMAAIGAKIAAMSAPIQPTPPPVALAVAAAEDGAELQMGEHGNGAGDGGGDGHGQGVVVLHVRELVRHHACQFLARHGLESPVDAQTAAFCGLRPVAKALGWGLCMM